MPPTIASHGIVATTHPLAAQIGIDILKAGGNAMDAAIATNAAMGLMEPMSCGIGGDLFAIVHWKSTNKMYGLNASGRAPENFNLDICKKLNLTELPNTGPLSWSVPGCVDGWAVLLEKFGSMPLAKLLAPSIHYATAGVAVPPTIAKLWANATALLQQHESTAKTFLPSGRAPSEGELFTNPDLARAYQLLADHGPAAFYHGEIPEKIVRFSQQVGGHFSLNDFAHHTSSWVNPVSTDYRGNRVWEIPPPGQGISVLQMLNIVEPFDLASMGPLSPDFWHLAIEAKKLAYADRARFYADPDFVKVPTEALISKDYAAQRRKLIDMHRASTHLDPGDPKLAHSDTIYLSVVDKDRNCVSLIQSNYKGFGSGLVPTGLGFTIQNRGSLFALDPAHPNCLAPKKRPFHTIIPAFVTRNAPETKGAPHGNAGPKSDPREGISAGTPYFVFGVMGGDMQPQGQFRILTNIFDFKMDIHQAGLAPRMEHVGSPTPTGKPAEGGGGGGSVIAEKEIPQSTLDELQRRGHHIAYGSPNNNAYQGILLDPNTNTLQGASEPRRDGKALGY